MEAETFTFDALPMYGELFLKQCLQRSVLFRINEKTIKKGKLILFKRNHYFIQMTVLNENNSRESFEVPFPLHIEFHEKEGLMYFDYRIAKLNLKEPLNITKKVSSSYFNKILEIQLLTQ